MPYCDAMLIDNAWGAMLNENPLRSDLRYKAQIFCLNKKDEFISYLEGLEETATDAMVENAQLLYGVL
jgi:hypothetical protein